MAENRSTIQTRSSVKRLTPHGVVCIMVFVGSSLRFVVRLAEMGNLGSYENIADPGLIGSIVRSLCYDFLPP